MVTKVELKAKLPETEPVSSTNSQPLVSKVQAVVQIPNDPREPEITRSSRSRRIIRTDDDHEEDNRDNNNNTNSPVTRTDEIFRSRMRSSDETRQAIKEKLIVANSTKTATVHLDKGSRIQDEKTNRLFDLYLDVRDLILGEILLDGQQNEVRDFTVRFKLGVATFTNPGTRKKETIYLSELTDPTIKGVVKEYLDLADDIYGYRADSSYTFNGDNKGAVNGKKPFTNTPESLQVLPKSFEQCRKKVLSQAITNIEKTADRRKVVERYHFVEKMHKGMSEKLNTLVQQTRTEYTNAPKSTAQERKAAGIIRKDLRKLHEVQMKLKNLNAFGLVWALGHYPTENDPELLEERLEDVEAELRNVFKLNDKKRYEKEKELEKIQQEEDFLQSVISLMLITRTEHYEHFRKKDWEMKQDSLEDLFVREAIKYMSFQTSASEDLLGDTTFAPRYRPHVFHALFDGLSDRMKEKTKDVVEDALWEAEISFANAQHRVPNLFQPEGEDYTSDFAEHDLERFYNPV